MRIGIEVTFPALAWLCMQPELSYHSPHRTAGRKWRGPRTLNFVCWHRCNPLACTRSLLALGLEEATHAFPVLPWEPQSPSPLSSLQCQCHFKNSWAGGMKPGPMGSAPSPGCLPSLFYRARVPLDSWRSHRREAEIECGNCRRTEHHTQELRSHKCSG